MSMGSGLSSERRHGKGNNPIPEHPHLRHTPQPDYVKSSDRLVRPRNPSHSEFHSGWRLHVGLCLVQTSETGVCYDKGELLSLDSTLGLHTEPAPDASIRTRALQIKSGTEQPTDWHVLPRSKRFLELDKALGHSQWHGPVVDGV